MKLTKQNKIIAEFIPVILLIFYYLFQFQFLQFSHTVLGKLVLIGIIVFYSAFVDRLIGAAGALLFIFYYQTDYVENFYGSYMNGDDGASEPTIEKFEPAGEADLYDNITTSKINVEAEILPKQSRNLEIVRTTEGAAESNPAATPGVISEAFIPY